MSSRDIWSRAGSLEIRDLLASLLSTRLMNVRSGSPIYVCSPFLTDFPLFDNSFGQFATMFRNRTDFAEKREILFSDSLIELSYTAPVRIITVQGEYSSAFLSKVIQQQNPNVSARFASQLFHEKGLASESFYIEGSMNFTYNGVYRREEKIVLHTWETPAGRQKISSASLEFERLWNNRAPFEVPRH